MSEFDDFQARSASAANVFFWWYAVPAVLGAFLLLTCCSQTFREGWFGPDYGNRSTPAYHGQPSRWQHMNPLYY